MKINVTNGVQQIVDSLKNNPEDKQWFELRNKIDVILLSNNSLKTSEDKQDIRRIDNLSHEERKTYIMSKWGPMYLDRCMPILIQLSILEKNKS